MMRIVATLAGGQNLLVHTMTGRGDPELVQQGAAAPVGRGETEE